ncbi:MAG: sugar ABC transporter permease [Oscillospiraceae bacterium]|nr:sugar ABC transporter permease [Oscillospiraceae bacterium]
MKATLVKLNRKLGDKLYSGAFLAPSFIGVMTFFIAPFFVVIYYAMIDSPVRQNFVWFDNFERVLGNWAFQTAAQHTIMFSAIAVPLAVALALGLAVLLEQKIPAKSQLRTFFLSPMMVPVASIVLIWQVLFHQNGAVNDLLSTIGSATGWFSYERFYTLSDGRVINQWIDWFSSGYNQFPIVLLFLWKNLGYNMILFMAALNNIPKDLIEVAQIEGGGAFYIFRTVKMRFLSPTILFVTILSLINSFRVFREVFLLTGAHPYGGLYMLQHYMNNMFEALDFQSLAAAAIIMCIVMIGIIGLLFLIESRYGKDVEG